MFAGCWGAPWQGWLLPLLLFVSWSWLCGQEAEEEVLSSGEPWALSAAALPMLRCCFLCLSFAVFPGCVNTEGFVPHSSDSVTLGGLACLPPALPEPKTRLVG